MYVSTQKTRFADPASTAMGTIACLVLAAVAFTVSPVAHGEEAATSVSVTISNIQTPEGVIRVGLFDEASYDGGNGINGVNIDVDGSEVTASIEGVAPGSYGIKLFHDVNDDGEMGTNPFGMPTEPFAFSNNARGRFGPAKWDAAKFEVTADGAEQIISLGSE